MVDKPQGASPAAGDEDSYVRAYWDPVRGLTVARLYLGKERLHLAKDNKRKERLRGYYEFLENAETLLLHLFTLPPETLTVSRDHSLVALKVPMPLGDAPKPLFSTIIMNLIHNFSRLRWNAPWNGFAYGLYQMASHNSGYMMFYEITQLLNYYLKRLWASIICNGILFNYDLKDPRKPVSPNDNTVSRIFGPDCPDIVAGDPDPGKGLPGAFQPHVNNYCVLLGCEDDSSGSSRLALDVLVLRDLYLISMMLGKLSIMRSIGTRYVSILSISKQARLEEMSAGDPCKEEPFNTLYNMIFGDPTAAGIIPVISAISRVYGGGLWSRIPRLYAHHTVTSDCRIMSLAEILGELYEPPMGAPANTWFRGEVESSLFLESLDVYTSSVFYMPWERASMVTIMLRYLGEAFRLLSEAKTKGVVRRMERSVYSALYRFPRNTIAVPLLVDVGPGHSAIVYKQKIPHDTMDVIEGSMIRIPEYGRVEDHLSAIVTSIRTLIATVSDEVTSILLSYYNRLIRDIRPYQPPSTDWYRFLGLAYEISSPIIDLVPNYRVLAKVISHGGGVSRRLLTSLIDRLTDSEYIKIFIYLVVEITDPARMVELVDQRIVPPTGEGLRVRDILERVGLLRVNLARVAERVIQDAPEDLLYMIENVKLAMSNFEYDTF